MKVTFLLCPMRIGLLLAALKSGQPSVKAERRCGGSYPGRQLPLLRRVLLGHDARAGRGGMFAVVPNDCVPRVVTTPVRSRRRKHFLLALHADNAWRFGFGRPRRRWLVHTAMDDGTQTVRF